MAVTEFEQVEDIHGYDPLRHPCVDLSKVPDLSDDAAFNEWLTTPDGQAMHDFMERLTEKDFEAIDMQGNLCLVQDFQKNDPDLVAGTNGLKLEIVSAAELQKIEINEPGWWDKKFDAATDGLTDWANGITDKFKSAHDDTPEPEPKGAEYPDAFSLDRAADDLRNRGDQMAMQMNGM